MIVLLSEICSPRNTDKLIKKTKLLFTSNTPPPPHQAQTLSNYEYYRMRRTSPKCEQLTLSRVLRPIGPSFFKGHLLKKCDLANTSSTSLLIHKD
jgi:hypothetical protein